jgi:hypothetical protein
MADDIEFLSNVRTLATNGTLTELLRRLEEDQVQQWKSEILPENREKCWYALEAISLLRAKIEGLNNEDKVRAWQNARMARRI